VDTNLSAPHAAGADAPGPLRWRTRSSAPTSAPVTDGGTVDLLRSLMDTCADGLALVDAQGVITLANDAFGDVIGVPAAQAVGIPLSDLVTPGGRTALASALQCAVVGRTCDQRSLVLRDRTGVAQPSEVELVPVAGGRDGGPTALVIVRSAVNEHYRLACERTPLGMGITDADGRLVQVNEPLARLVGRSPSDLVGCRITDVVHEDSVAAVETLLARVRTAEAARDTGHAQLLLPGGEMRWLRLSLAAAGDGFEGHLVLQADDVTPEQTDRRRLSFLAHHDALTGLLNRAALEIRCGESAAAELAVLMIDLDGFKAVNDRQGHAAGDALLVAVGERLQGCVRATDLVARIGGDEFVIVLLDAGQATATATARRVVEAMQGPVGVDGVDVSVGASVGVALASHAGPTLDGLLRAADAALYEVKRTGKNGYAFAPAGVE
jgi:diguanylate cyclase (GGDEF)-like protein/PAS domain S-box-containing protein